MSRSRRVAPEQIQQVKLACKRKGFSSLQALATKMKMARYTISNFLNGKPVDFQNFVDICEQLGLNWQAIAANVKGDTFIEDDPSVEIQTDLLANTTQESSAYKAASLSTEIYSDEEMAFTSRQLKRYEFLEAEFYWNLKKLYADLGSAKLRLTRRWGLTEVEKESLRGLLCGYSPDEIAKELYKSIGTVRIQLSNSLYRYVEELLHRPPKSLKNWRDIVIWLAEAGYRLDTQLKQKEQNASIDIDILVQQVRQKVKPFIQEHCGLMRVLDMPRPIGLNDIFTNVNILEQISGHRYLHIAALLQGLDDPAKLDRFGLDIIVGERMSGLKAVDKYSKLIVMGKPGAGKTTFLKYLAIQCNKGEMQSVRVPIFITLKDFTDDESKPTLLNYIIQMLSPYNVVADEIEQLLKKGRTLVLLDGLDEVRQEHNSYVLKEIREFSNRYYINHFVMTCRIGATEYRFEEFAEVEIADFDRQQIDKFAQNWFSCKNPATAKKFMQKLEGEPRIKELATNPLLLTLLCLVFEQEGRFPKNRYDFYKEAIDILLTKWDVSRNIKRDEIYKNLSLGNKKDLLSYIANKTFEQGEYFFMQINLVGYIADYLRNFPDAITNSKELQLDSEAVLKSIEAQHGLLVERAKGIYSFSHLTFFEYFTARKIASSSDPDRFKKALESLVSHITDKRWREIFLLAVIPLKPADYLLKLMKNQVDNLLAKDDKLQDFLKWVHEQSIRIADNYKPAALRAFYLDGDINIDIYRTLSCLIDLNCTYVLECASFLSRTLDIDIIDTLSIVLKLDRDFTRYRALEPAMAIVFARALAIEQVLHIAPELNPELKQVLQGLKEQLVDLDENEEILIDWLKEKGQAWAEQVRLQIFEYHQFGKKWQFNEKQKELIQQYYEANVLLVGCLKNAYVSRELRQEIEYTLLLPIDEIERRK